MAILTFGAISALGEGEAAASAGAPGERARVAIARDPELEAAGLARPFAARAVAPEEDRATALLTRALGDCLASLDLVRPGWRSSRVGAAIGTSSGGMRSAESFFRGEAVDPVAVTYFGPLHDAFARHRLAASPASLILGACASATIAIGLAARWLEDERCDVALAGGFDAVSVLVAAGFEALRATTAALPPRPFRIGRDGMALGEGAAILALAREGAARAYVSGFAASCDAVHVTAPDRTGGGLARAAKGALGGVLDVGLVSAHGTATPFNDAAEARALEAALGARASSVPVHPFKAQIGHTLGAAGALEALACLDAITRGVVPAAAGEGPLDADAAVRLLDVASVSEPPRTALKLSSAFGGANAALLLSREPLAGPALEARPVYVTRAVRVTEVPRNLDVPAPTLARIDRLVALGLAAVAALAQEVGALEGAGIVVGHTLASLETNALFYERMRARGARMAEPRRFPYTSPNAVAGECAVQFKLTGPAFAVGAGPTGGLEALAVARDLVRAGDADRIVVLAVDDVGPAAARLGLGVELETGAAAALVTTALAAARLGRIDLGLAQAHEKAHACGHLALVPLTQNRLPNCLESRGLGAFAKVALDAL